MQHLARVHEYEKEMKRVNLELTAASKVGATSVEAKRLASDVRIIGILVNSSDPHTVLQ